MKNTFLNILILTLISSSCANSQKTINKRESLEYAFINQNFYEILNIEYENYVLLNIVPANLVDLKAGGESFFSKNNFTNYTYPAVGVDTDKIKFLTTNLDFNYFKNQSFEKKNWEKEKLKNPVTLTDAKPTKVNEIVYHLSKPVFNKENSFAFVLYSASCVTYLNCGSTTVKIYKKKEGKWTYYTKMPISLN